MKKLIFILILFSLSIMAVAQDKRDPMITAIDSVDNVLKTIKARQITSAKLDSLDLLLKSIKDKSNIGYKIDSLTLLQKSIKDRVNINYKLDSLNLVLKSLKDKLGYRLDSLGMVQKTIKDKNTTTSVTTVKNFNLQFALAGAEIVTDAATPHTGQFNGIQILADAVISAITYDADVSVTGNSLVAVTLPAGMWIPLQCTSVTLTSGKVLLPKRVK